ncbi:O-acetyl-ADP-ribose deacetylase [Vibrio sp. S4M6]|uniref:O-acetyl-ADP-ribose deacetylase n=1 Tax=Vibrio sinus TaxID=2946865 RepID=UPI002029D881|nr:O-acetyl-ADP-ribose deacetylase [Vibrio sinus]MCL9780053.1 O-acetyl-ADP-ribose deacetylase [Vibrio sinus]
MSTNIQLVHGDITTAVVDVIVNAANPSLLGGGGVDGAIHSAAGSKLLSACRKLPDNNGIRCPHGGAKITEAGDLHANYVIHAVGPIYSQSHDPETTLRSAYASSLDLAIENQCQSIAFPAISCGVYGYPLPDAANIALTTCLLKQYAQLDIRFYLFNQTMFTLWQQQLDRLT